jgi:hypothetical protein
VYYHHGRRGCLREARGAGDHSAAAIALAVAIAAPPGESAARTSPALVLRGE